MAAKGPMCSDHSRLSKYSKNVVWCIKICSPHTSWTWIWTCFSRPLCRNFCMQKYMYQYWEIKIILHICYLKHEIGYCKCIVNWVKLKLLLLNLCQNTKKVPFWWLDCYCIISNPWIFFPCCHGFQRMLFQ